MLADLQKQLGIDATLGVQFVTFFVVYLWLRFVFFGPYLRLQEARKQSTSGLKDEAASLEEQAEKAENAYRDGILAARKEAAASRDRLVQEAHGKAAAVVDGARKEMKLKMDGSRDLMARQSAQGLAELDGQVEALGVLVVEKLTSAKVGL